MGNQIVNQGQAWIRQEVMDQGLCTGCASCVGLCPYQQSYRGETVVVHDCDRQEGRCRAYCPRTPTDLAGLFRALFNPADLTPELGPFKGLFMARAADGELRRAGQHGGTVSALMALALSEGLIDAAVLAGRDDDGSAQSEIVRRAEDVADRAGSKFVVSPTVAGFNLASRGEAVAIGVVATPCQALALAKMRVHSAPGDEDRVGRLRLVIGLFCGWALSWRKLRDLLDSRVGTDRIRGLDIPPSRHQCLEVYTDRGTRQIPIEEVQACVRESCAYCHDMTAELADISVGSARSPEGWAVDRGWNQVIVRSALGQDLLDLARQKGVLEFKAVPSGNLARLKQASQNKKRAGQDNLAQKLRGREAC